MRLPLALLACIALGLVCTDRAEAQTGLQRQVAATEQENTQFLARYPKMRDVSAVLRGRCASEPSSVGMSQAYCSCGAAVTMSVWRSGVDSKMLERIKDFINGAGILNSESFLQFQGPELYGPLCSSAEGKLGTFKRSLSARVK